MTDAALQFEVTSDDVAKATGRLSDLADHSTRAGRAADDLGERQGRLTKATEKMWAQVQKAMR